MEITNLSEKLADPKTFPALPDVVTSIVHEIDLGSISIGNLGKIVQKDVGFATQIIRHANTGAYIAAGQVTTITQAIRLIGFRMLKGFCLTVPLFSNVRHVAGIDALWYHSRVTSLCCRILAERIEFAEPELAETAGLLHDIGKVYLALHEQAFFTERTQLADQVEQGSDWMTERRVLQVDHCFIGARYGRMFQFPPNIIDCLLWHHEPHKSPAHQDLVHLLRVGEELAVMVGAEHPDSIFVEPSVLFSLDFLDVNRSQFRKILEECLEKAQTVTFVDL
jgi:putative nucleotidyltransferase with HDIG domain